MEKFANAVKALVIHKNKLLILKNALDDKYRPGEADYPGGRLEPGENPYTGLKREVAEELGPEFAKALHIGRPLDIRHFERPDGQTVTMMLFFCAIDTDIEIKLSPEHSSYEWVDFDLVEKVLSDSKRTSNIMLDAYNLI